MERFCVSYPKHGVDIACYNGYDYICLSAIFTHNNILYLINKNTHRKQLNHDVRVLCNIKNKDSALYLLAINLIVVGVIIYYQIMCLQKYCMVLILSKIFLCICDNSFAFHIPIFHSLSGVSSLFVLY